MEAEAAAAAAAAAAIAAAAAFLLLSCGLADANEHQQVVVDVVVGEK
jgi:hypothetical protein